MTERMPAGVSGTSMKPRLRWHRQGIWTCSGQGFSTSGFTPQAAYAFWQSEACMREIAKKSQPNVASGLSAFSVQGNANHVLGVDGFWIGRRNWTPS